MWGIGGGFQLNVERRGTHQAILVLDHQNALDGDGPVPAALHRDRPASGPVTPDTHLTHYPRRVIPLLQGIEHLSALVFDRDRHCLSENVYARNDRRSARPWCSLSRDHPDQQECKPESA